MSTLGWVLIILLLCGFFGVFPAWPHAQNWGYGPSGIVVVVLIIVVVLAVTGRL